MKTEIVGVNFRPAILLASAAIGALIGLLWEQIFDLNGTPQPLPDVRFTICLTAAIKGGLLFVGLAAMYVSCKYGRSKLFQDLQCALAACESACGVAVISILLCAIEAKYYSVQPPPEVHKVFSSATWKDLPPNFNISDYNSRLVKRSNMHKDLEQQHLLSGMSWKAVVWLLGA
jgi:hypothetical protein